MQQITRQFEQRKLHAALLLTESRLRREKTHCQCGRLGIGRGHLALQQRRKHWIKRQARVQLLRDLGPAVAPFNAFLIAQGIETLSLRMERHISNAQRVAEWLEKRDEVESVAYAGLPSSAWYERGRKYAPAGTGAVVAFEIKGGIEAGKKFVDALELHSHVANIGDVRSLVIHPASTTHSQLSDEERATAGVTPGLVRLAVGIEGIEDILADLDAGFRAAKGA